MQGQPFGGLVKRRRSTSTGDIIQTGSPGRDPQAEVRVDTLEATLRDRIDEIIRAHQAEPIRSTTGSRAAIEELARRYVGLEIAVREIALEVQTLATSQKD